MRRGIRAKRPPTGAGTRNGVLPQPDSVESQLLKTLDDSYFSPWPNSLVNYLNLSFDPDPELVKAYKARHPNWRDSWPSADPKVARRLRRGQKHVRAIVDSVLAGATPEQVVTTLGEELPRVRVTPSLWLRSKLGLPVPLSGSPFALRWCRWTGPDLEVQSALVDLARLLDTGEWRSLRKCSQCQKYFMGYDRRRKKYCSQQCMWQATQRRFRSKETQAARERRQRKDRERYLRRTGREAGLALSK